MVPDFSRLPARVTVRICEYLYWQGVRDTDMNTYAGMPIGQLDLLPVMQTCRAWRTHALPIFYEAAVIVIGNGTSSPGPSTLSKSSGRSLMIKSNIELTLFSGRAPLTKHLVLFSNRHTEPMDFLIELEITDFAQYEWPSITTLFYHHPRGTRTTQTEKDKDEQDEAIATNNTYLINSLPALERIRAMSNTRDSYGLYSIDDLVTAKKDTLRDVILLSRRSVTLGIQAFPNNLTHLALYSTDCKSAMQLPKATASSLVSLAIGPIAPTDIWGQFTGSSDDASAPVDFTSLQFLRLNFCNTHLRMLSGAGAKEAKKATNRYASPGPNNEVIKGVYPLFPRLESLAICAYPYNIAQFLENFPRSQIKHLRLTRCPNKIFGISWTNFHRLVTCVVDIPSMLTDNYQDRLEAWLTKDMLKHHRHLKELRIVAVSAMHISLPHHSSLPYLQSLTLDLRFKFSDMPSLLLCMPKLRFLTLMVYTASNKAKDLVASRSTKHAIVKHDVISKSLEQMTIYIYDLSSSRAERTLTKAAWLLARIPNVIRFRTQHDYVHTAQKCVQETIEDTHDAPPSIRHLRNLQYRVVSDGSRGIGEAIAIRLFQEGASIAIAVKTADPHSTLPGTIYTAAKAIETAGSKILPVQYDIRDEKQVQAALAKTVETFGHLGVAANNASAIYPKSTVEADPKRYDLMRIINGRGTWLVTKLALLYLTKSKNPRVLTMNPPLDLSQKWLEKNPVCTVAKHSIFLYVLAALNMIDEAKGQLDLRTPEIMADAAVEVLRKPVSFTAGPVY
ncbi:hypothetical protein FBU59_000593 [Linderina macrospora]|uniref:Uncharacterized protein n=1 Tax=Linderina macrospora TaxID=4868 RepID=A0ACC1JGR9_9FUNG|nr:hypothetical protein FBU59_000593 [Linderina macrospora]